MWRNWMDSPQRFIVIIEISVQGAFFYQEERVHGEARPVKREKDCGKQMRH